MSKKPDKMKYMSDEIRTDQNKESTEPKIEWKEEKSIEGFFQVIDSNSLNLTEKEKEKLFSIESC